MKKLLIALLMLVWYATSTLAAPFVYFNWTVPDNAQVSDYKIILLGLPDSPIEATFAQAVNPDDANDTTYFKANYDLKDLPDGSYTLTGKIKSIWAESAESEPFPFVKAVPGGISSVHLDF